MSTQARVATSMDAFITVCPFCCARSSTHTLIRSAWIILHTTSYVYLSVRPVTCLAPHVSHVSQQAIYPYDCHEDQKFWNMCDERGAFRII